MERTRGAAKTPRTKALAKAISLDPDEIFHADDRWIRLMSNRIYFQDFMAVILRNSALEGPVCYQGNFFYSTAEDITPLIDEETHDIVSLAASRFTPVAGQTIYPSVTEFFLDKRHRPIENCTNIYCVGDIHGTPEGGDFNVHWNCFICVLSSKPGASRVVWYDPAISKESVDAGVPYDFSQPKKQSILNSLFRFTGRLPVDTKTPVVRAQRVCNAAFDCVDSFCQTWVMMYVSAFIEGRDKEFLNLPFDKYANLVLKTWLYCLVRNEGMSEWMKELQSKDLKDFEYCRLPPTVFKSSTKAGAVRELRILKVETLDKMKGQTCMDAVLKRFKE